MARKGQQTAIASMTGGTAYDAVLITGRCVITGFLVETDGANDPTIDFWDNTAGSGTQAIPSATYDTSVLGINGVMGLNKEISTSLYVKITCASAAKVFVYYL